MDAVNPSDPGDLAARDTRPHEGSEGDSTMSDLLRPEDASDRGALATGQMSRQGFLLRAAAGGVLIA